MAEEEILLEVEAVQAVYGDDCVVLSAFPPHLHLHVKPRTAEITSQQFVEALISIRAGVQYPEEPPSIIIIESKGLDELRQKVLLTSIHNKALELSSCFMLVALCEHSYMVLGTKVRQAAVEQLSIMNHPDGDCPLCLYPLVQEKEEHEILPFMKLMSCFHCYHSECIIRWWTWLQKQQEKTSTSSTRYLEPIRVDTKIEAENSMGQCPVCRKVFHSKDLKHVLDLVGSHSSDSMKKEGKDDEEEAVVDCEREHIRREKFEAILKLQEEKQGLIEPKKSIVVVPGMFLPQPPPPPTTSTTSEQQTELPPTGDSSERRSGIGRRRSKNRNQHNSQRPVVKQWARKGNGTSN
ncbi:E3 ubiquitin-protein ligase RNF25 [Linum grandiflorum]